MSATEDLVDYLYGRSQDPNGWVLLDTDNVRRIAQLIEKLDQQSNELLHIVEELLPRVMLRFNESVSRTLRFHEEEHIIDC